MNSPVQWVYGRKFKVPHFEQERGLLVGLRGESGYNFRDELLLAIYLRFVRFRALTRLDNVPLLVENDWIAKFSIRNYFDS